MREMRERVIQFLESTGMWTQENRAKYDFLLSPDTFPVRKEWEKQLAGFARVLRGYFNEKVGTFPALCKVDVMIDRNGSLKIAEIDGLNKRALGYAILQRKVAVMFGHNAERFFPGNEHTLKRMLGGKALFVVVPGREKYYRFGFNFLIEALRGLGVEATWGHEKATASFLRAANPDRVTLLDAPKTGHRECDGQIAREWEVLIPNQPFFSSKENLVGFESPLVPRTLPGTISPVAFDRYVTKHVAHSGCKGVFFHDEEHSLNPQECIIQELVEGSEFEFSHFDQNGQLVRSDGWKIRLIVTLDMVDDHVVDVDVTACKNRLVHGQADSIQIAGVRE